MKNLIHIFLLGIVFFGNAQETIEEALKKYNINSVPYIKVEKLASTADAIILDAREPSEYNISHIKNALLVGYDQFDLETTVKQLEDKKQTIIVYCSIGVRSEDIANRLKKAGYNDIYNLYGGIFEWKNKDYPVFDKKENETEKVHVFSKFWGTFLKKGKKVY